MRLAPAWLCCLAAVALGAPVTAKAQTKAAPSPPAEVFREMRRNLREKDRLSPEQLELLLKHTLSDKVGADETEARTTFRVLGRSVAPLVLDRLRETLRSEDPKDKTDKQAAVAALGLLGSHAAPALPELKKILAGEDLDLAARAVASAERLGPVAAPVVPELMKLAFESKITQLSYDARRTIGALGDGAKLAVPQLRKYLATQGLDSTLQAVDVVALLGNSAKEATPELLQLAASTQDPILRHRVVSAIARMDDPRAIEFLQRTLKTEKVVAIRHLAANALASRSKASVKEAWREAAPPPPKKAEKPMELPYAANTTQLCEALNWLDLNPEWPAPKGVRAEFKQAGEGWDIGVQSLQLLLRSRLNVISGPNLSGPNRSGPDGEPTPCPQNPSAPIQAELEAFSQSLLSLMERAQLPNDAFWSGGDLYAKVFRTTLLKQVGQDTTELDRALVLDVERMRTSGLGGSAFNTYAWGVSMVALQGAAPRETFKFFEEWVDSHRDPLALRYAPDPAAFPETRRGSSARNVPVYLALYLRNKDIKRAGTLVDAITNWMENAGELAKEVPINQTHNEKNDNIAPYYFFSSLPYVTSAIKILEGEGRLPAAAKKKIVEAKSRLREALPKLMQQGKLQLLPGIPGRSNNLYYSAPAYTYPLYGLALIPLLQEGDACYRPGLKDDLGIVPLPQR
jgi:HEAT repeat protein